MHFFTRTFPADSAPNQDAAHTVLRSLVRRLRYRDQLEAYGWVLHRQQNEAATLHYHGIAHMPCLDDGLEEWLGLIQASGSAYRTNSELLGPSALVTAPATSRRALLSSDPSDAPTASPRTSRSPPYPLNGGVWVKLAP